MKRQKGQALPFSLNTIVQIDCLEGLKKLPDGCIDLTFTSPPYNLATSSGGGIAGAQKIGKWKRAYKNWYPNDAKPIEEYIAWQKEVLKELWRVTSDTGAIYYNHKPRVQNKELWLPLELNPGLPLRQIVVWSRSGGINFNLSFYCTTYEWIMIFARPDFRLKTQGASGIGDVWKVRQDIRNPHPAAFPVDLPYLAIESTRAQIILDPFMGSGTTALAAKLLGRDYLGFEVDPKYIEMAEKRLKRPQHRLF